MAAQPKSSRLPVLPAPMTLSSRHLRFGWWSLFTYLVLGLVLESFHGFKFGWYLDVGNETRRLMFTLAHAHGTLLAVVNLAAGLCLRGISGLKLSRSASFALLAASVLLPLGFLLGGWDVHGGDPGFGIWLAPIGALLLLFGVARFSLEITRATREKI